MLGPRYQKAKLTCVVKWETKVRIAATPSLVLLLVSSVCISSLTGINMLLNNGPGFAEVFNEHNFCVTLPDFLSQILVFMAQVLFISEVFSPVRRCSIKTGEVF